VEVHTSLLRSRGYGGRDDFGGRGPPQKLSW
jgi:hypothetical protein